MWQKRHPEPNAVQPDTGLPVVFFTIRGRRTGTPRRVPLMRVELGGRYLMVASNGGAERHPAWYHSVIANPDIHVQDGPDVHPARARLLSGAERAEWWRVAVTAFPYYGTYQAGIHREIPLFLAERIWGSVMTWDDDFEKLVHAALPDPETHRPLDPDASLSALGLGSLETVVLIVSLEDHYGIRFDDDLGADAFRTAGSLWSTVSRARGDR